MGKKCFVMLLLLFIAGSVFAVEFTPGISAGLNMGWFSGDDWDDMVDYFDASNDSKMGYSFGFFLDMAFSESFSIQPELNVTGSGGGISADNLYDADYDVYYDEKVTQTAKILNMPVLFKFKVPAGSGKLSLFAGPLFGLLLGDIKLTDQVTVKGYGSDSADIDVEADNNLVFGFTLGAGFEFPMGSGKLFTDLRYSRALTSFFDDDDTKANNIGINLGYGF
ncbi:MAG: porin family protein [Spirochaetia bacterium]|jgi:hypothetical protein|nr:porin family protein [Spirochaetia bacterium]